MSVTQEEIERKTEQLKAESWDENHTEQILRNWIRRKERNGGHVGCK